jgi:hypothetical protein
MRRLDVRCGKNPITSGTPTIDKRSNPCWWSVIVADPAGQEVCQAVSPRLGALPVVTHCQAQSSAHQPSSPLLPPGHARTLLWQVSGRPAVRLLRSVWRLRRPSPAAPPLRSLERPLFVCRQSSPPLIECPLCVDGVECLFDRTRLCPVPGCGLSHRPPSSASRDTAEWRSCQDDLESSRESWCQGLFDLDHWDAPLKETHRPSHLDSFVPDARADGSRARESG